MEYKEMSRELICTLLQRQIDELMLMTEGFMEMTSYPNSIIQLAQLKNEEISEFLSILGNLTPADVVTAISENEVVEEKIISPVIQEEEIIAETPENEVETSEETEEVEIDEDEDEDDEVAEEIEEEESETEEVVTIEILAEENPDSLKSIVIIEEEINTQETEQIKVSVTLNERLNKDDNSINSHLSHIQDIRTAISVGDRFRFQRELFKGNGEDMNKTLSYLNQLATFNEAESFLRSKYNWSDENVTADDFYHLLKRKY